MRRTWLLPALGLVALSCVMALVACGRVGPPAPAGPPNKITWPRSYPTH